MEGEVLIGKKETMAYVLAVTTQAAKNDRILIKARGRAISKAADISQIATHRFLQGWKLGEIKIGTEERPYTPTDEEKEKGVKKETQRVSTIEIELIKEELK